jgi:hypothetical protein
MEIGFEKRIDLAVHHLVVLALVPLPLDSHPSLPHHSRIDRLKRKRGQDGKFGSVEPDEPSSSPD